MRQDRPNEAVAAIQNKGLITKALPLDQVGVPTLPEIMVEHAFDVVVNSAGIARLSSAVDTMEADYEALMHVNLCAAYFLSALAAKAMLKVGKPGSIIHISTRMEHTGGPARPL